MTLIDIRTQLKQAMIAKDTDRLSVIRMLLSAINYAAMNQKKKEEEMSEEDIANVVMKEIKSRKEGISDFETKGDIDKVTQEKAELKILEEFAPKFMDEQETKTEVEKILSSIDPKPAVGPAIGIVMKQLKGKANPEIVQKVIKEILS